MKKKVNTSNSKEILFDKDFEELLPIIRLWNVTTTVLLYTLRSWQSNQLLELLSKGSNKHIITGAFKSASPSFKAGITSH